MRLDTRAAVLAVSIATAIAGSESFGERPQQAKTRGTVIFAALHHPQQGWFEASTMLSDARTRGCTMANPVRTHQSPLRRGWSMVCP